MTEKSTTWVRWIAFAGLALAAVAAILLLIAGPGTRFGWWPFFTGFSLLTYGAYVGIAALVVSLIGAVGSRLKGQNPAFVAGLAGIIIGLVVVYVPLNWRNVAQSVPPIHDITTNLENPPPFEAVVSARGENENPLEYGGEEIAKQQRAAYPEIGPVETSLPPDTVFMALTEAVADTGWEIVEIDSNAMRIEATATTFWFGFKDDIVLTVNATGSGSRVDMRSQSRIGRSDIGTNARRIEQFLGGFEARIAEMEGTA